MSFAKEMKDFLEGFKAVSDMNYKRKLADYYAKNGEKKKSDPFSGYGDSEEEDDNPSLLGRLFRPTETETPKEGVPTDPWVRAYERAYKANDPVAASAILKNAKLHTELPNPSTLRPGEGKATVRPKAKPQPAPERPPNYGIPPDPTPGGNAPAPLPSRINFRTDEEDPYVTQDIATGGMVGNPGAAQEETDDGISGELSDMAMPGYAAALRRISQQIEPRSAVPDPSNRGRNPLSEPNEAATNEEIEALDQMVDPEGKLPPHARSAARIAAVWDFYGDHDPDKGAALAQRLLLKDKANSQTRGAMALHSLQQGDVASAAKFIADAYDRDLPGSARIIPAVATSGDITARIVQGGQTVDEVEVKPAQLQQIAAEVASGKAYGANAVDLVAKWEAGKKARADKAAADPIDTDIQRGLLETRQAYARALKGLASAADEDKPKWQEHLNKVEDALRAQIERGKDYAFKQPNPAKVLRALGIGAVPDDASVPNPGRGKSLAAPGGKKAEEPDPVQSIQQRLANADLLEQHGVVVDENGRALVKREPGYKATDEEREAAAKSIEPIRQRLKIELGDKAFEAAEQAPGYKSKNFKDRESDSETAITGFFKDTTKPGEAEKVPEKGDMRRYKRMMDRILSKNDANPYDVIEFIRGIETGAAKPDWDLKTGKVTAGGTRLFVDRETMADLARARGETIVAQKKAEEQKAAAAKTDADNRVIKSIEQSIERDRARLPYGTPIDREAIPPNTGFRNLPNTPDAQDMANDLAELESTINRLRVNTHPSMRGQPNPQIDMLEMRAQELRNKLRLLDRQGTPRQALPSPDQLNNEYPVRRTGPSSGVMVP